MQVVTMQSDRQTPFFSEEPKSKSNILYKSHVEIVNKCFAYLKIETVYTIKKIYYHRIIIDHITCMHNNNSLTEENNVYNTF